MATRGGARPGAGRKSIGTAPRIFVPFDVSLLKRMARARKRENDGAPVTVAEFVRRSIDDAIGGRKLKALADTGAERLPQTVKLTDVARAALERETERCGLSIIDYVAAAVDRYCTKRGF